MPIFSQDEKSEIFVKFDSLIYENATLAAEILDSIEYIIDDESYKGQLLKRKAILARVKSHYDDALAYNIEAIDLFQKQNDSTEIATVYHNLGFLMRYLKETDKSISYYQKAIALRSALDDNTALALSHREIGVMYRRKKEYEKAMHHYDLAKSYFDPISDKDELLTLKGNYASLYHVQKKYDQAIMINKEALPAIKKTKNAKSLSTRYGNIASAYSKLKNYDEAYIYVDSAITVAQEANLLEPHVRYVIRKAEITYKNNDYKSAYKNMRKYKILNDSLTRNAQKNAISNQFKNFELEKKHLQDSIKSEMLTNSLNYEQSEKNKIFWFSLYFLIFLLLALIWQSFRVKMTKLKSKNEELTKKLLEDKLRNTAQENERLVNQSQLQLEFKKSIIDKVDTISAAHTHPKTKIRDLQRLLMDQLRIENQSNSLNESIEELPSAYDQMLRDNYPSLTKGERKMCFLVKTGMSIKEIAAINDTSLTAVQSMRYRIRKKMDLKKGEELQAYLKGL